MHGEGKPVPVRAHEAVDSASVAGVVEVINPQGTSDVVLVCEHASSFIPLEFHDLGLGREELASHIAWDPGALAVARTMSARLDAVLVAQRVSRLVYDCNRPPESASAVPEESEIYRVPGNTGLTAAARRARAARYYFPFRDTLAAVIDKRLAAGRSPVVVTIHSFTPIFRGVARDVEIGILHDIDARLADALLAAGAGDGSRVMRRNEPYGPADGVTHTLIEQAVSRRLLNVMIEIRNDLIRDPDQQAAMARLLSDLVSVAYDAVVAETPRTRPAAGMT
jgi:predicted N-formylglutamate amidohydrolase